MIKIYMLSSTLATLSGTVFSLYTSTDYALAASGAELDAIAAVLIGGIGTVFGTLFGVLIQVFIQSYITFDGTLSSWWTKIVIDILLVSFIAIQKVMSVFYLDRWRCLQSMPLNPV